MKLLMQSQSSIGLGLLIKKGIELLLHIVSQLDANSIRPWLPMC